MIYKQDMIIRSAGNVCICIPFSNKLCLEFILMSCVRVNYSHNFVVVCPGILNIFKWNFYSLPFHRIACPDVPIKNIKSVGLHVC